MITINQPRAGDWFQTFSGIKFYPLDPSPLDIEIEDIAHSLSRICRFGGHVTEFYSVAQHSVIVSDLVSDEAPLAGLLHDATEAYVGDMVRPLKLQIPQYQEIENSIWFNVALRFNIPVSLPKEVKHADNVALLTERRDLLSTNIPWGDWANEFEPMPKKIIPLSCEAAEALFLNRFHDLTS